MEDESDKLLAAHFADAIDLTSLKRHQDRILAGLADIDRRIENEHDQDQGPRKQIAKALRLLIDCQRLYTTTDAHGKRLANQTFSTGIDINEDEEATLRLAEPFAATTSQNTMSGVRLRLKLWSLRYPTGTRCAGWSALIPRGSRVFQPSRRRRRSCSTGDSMSSRTLVDVLEPPRKKYMLFEPLERAAKA